MPRPDFDLRVINRVIRATDGSHGQVLLQEYVRAIDADEDPDPRLTRWLADAFREALDRWPDDGDRDYGRKVGAALVEALDLKGSRGIVAGSATAEEKPWQFAYDAAKRMDIDGLTYIAAKAEVAKANKVSQRTVERAYAKYKSEVRWHRRTLYSLQDTKALQDSGNLKELKAIRETPRGPRDKTPAG